MQRCGQVTADSEQGMEPDARKNATVHFLLIFGMFTVHPSICYLCVLETE